MAIDLFSIVMQQFGPDVVGRLANIAGLDKAAVTRALSALVPGLLTNFASSASTAAGAQSLLREAAAVTPADLAKLETKAAAEALVTKGSGLAHELIGAPATNGLILGVSRYSGLGFPQSQSLVGLSAPLVAHALGGVQKSQNLDAAGMAKLFGEQAGALKAHVPKGFSYLPSAAVAGAQIASVAAPAAGVATAATAVASTATKATATVAPAVAAASAAKGGWRGGQWTWLWVLLALGAGAWGLSSWQTQQQEAERERLAAIEKQRVADAAAAKARADADAKRKAEAELAAAKARAEAEAKALADKTAADRALADKTAADKAAQDKAAQDKAAQDKAATDKAAAEAEAKRKAEAEAEASKKAASAAASTTVKAAPAPIVAVPPPAAQPALTVQACQTAVVEAAKSGAIRFQVSSANLTAESVGTLDRVAAAIKQCPNAKVLVEGHTSSDGNPVSNQALSTNRAKSVADYLVKVGVDQTRLLYVGHGQSRPLVANDSDQNKAINRRIEFVVSDK